MQKIVPVDFNDYVKYFPKDTRAALREVRLAIKKAAPSAKETVSYNLPAFSLNGKILVWFAAFKAHVGLYPGAAAVGAFKNDLSAYRTAKGSIQFPLNRAMPLELIGRIVKFKAHVLD